MPANEPTIALRRPAPEEPCGVRTAGHGHAVAFGLGTTIPAGAVMDIASSQDITLIDMSDLLAPMKKLNPGYTLVTVPKGTRLRFRYLGENGNWFNDPDIADQSDPVRR